MNQNVFKIILLVLICSNSLNIFCADVDRKTIGENRVERNNSVRKMAFFTSIGAICIPVLLKICQTASKIRDLEDSVEDLKSSVKDLKKESIGF